MEESLNMHVQALVHFASTVGTNSYDASLICVKLGVHHTRLEMVEIARYSNKFVGNQ